MQMLTRLQEERQKTIDFIAQTVQGAEDQTRDLSKSEQETLARSRDRIKELDEQIKPLEEFAELQSRASNVAAQFRTPAAPAASEGRSAGVQLTDRAYEYRTAGEFLADGYRAVVQRDQAAVDRLASEGVVVRDGAIVREIQHETTTQVPGLLPKKIVGEILNDVDATRPLIQSLGVKDMSGIPGKTFSRPTVKQHVQVGKQTAEKTELPSRQFLVDELSFTKETFGGVLNVSKQVIDWTAPAAWDALMQDFLDEYAIETEKDVAAAFAAAVTASTPLASTGIDDVITAMYQGAATAYKASNRLPNTMWMSLDMWATTGAAIDKIRATGDGNGGGTTDVGSFAGNFLQIPRIVVPSFQDGTVIIGQKNGFEVYEDRIGFLSAVEPKLLGVELAYGGYLAKGMVRQAAFVKLAAA